MTEGERKLIAGFACDRPTCGALACSLPLHWRQPDSVLSPVWTAEDLADADFDWTIIDGKVLALRPDSDGLGTEIGKVKNVKFVLVQICAVSPN